MTRIALSLVLAGFAAKPALGHDVTYALRGTGDVAIAFAYQDGTPMAGATALVFAPDAGALPTTTAITDAAGEVRLHAAADSLWRVDVRDDAGHASRARVRFEGGVPARAERGIPNWLAAGSLVLNLLLAFRVAVSMRGRRAVVGRATLQPPHRGSLPT